jgi:hypothetical protein
MSLARCQRASARDVIASPALALTMTRERGPSRLALSLLLPPCPDCYTVTSFTAAPINKTFTFLRTFTGTGPAQPMSTRRFPPPLVRWRRSTVRAPITVCFGEAHAETNAGRPTRRRTRSERRLLCNRGPTRRHLKVAIFSTCVSPHRPRYSEACKDASHKRDHSSY